MSNGPFRSSSRCFRASNREHFEVEWRKPHTFELRDLSTRNAAEFDRQTAMLLNRIRSVFLFSVAASGCAGLPPVAVVSIVATT